jgi:GNAT superfamily N-acetyltransferase
MRSAAPICAPVYSGPFGLSDGRSVWLRPVCAADAPALAALYHRLSPETIRRRFFQLRPTCDPAQAEDLAAVDQVRRVAFAVQAEPSPTANILGVGRFHGDGSERAELALLVEDGYQGFGIGRLLLERLLREAHRLRLHVLDGYVLHNNTRVLHLLRSSGRPLEVRWHGGDVVEIKLTVDPETPPG